MNINYIEIYQYNSYDNILLNTNLPDVLEPNNFAQGISLSFDVPSGKAVDYVMKNFPNIPFSVYNKD